MKSAFAFSFEFKNRMFIPFVSSSSATKLSRRKGGGGRGGGGLGGSSGGKARKSGKASQSPSIQVGGGSTAKLYGSEGGNSFSYPNTWPNPYLIGRPTGGGSRQDIYGSRRYGSGYPGSSRARGVTGRGLPFCFWPIVWISAIIYLEAPEFGLPGRLDRPGGSLTSAAFKSNSTGTTYRLGADNETVQALSGEVTSKCSNLISDFNIAPIGNTSDSSWAQPEQAVQYYRGSSIVLTLDGYNNSAVFGSEDTPDTGLPDGIDTELLNCLNHTIGDAAPLVNSGRSLAPGLALCLVCLGFVWFSFLVL
ncbi:hypothetical protein BDZ94DRAFT_800336 [Collybia nuda]|uniref:Uncharacterized protein n=1 Tax=Collybia nuda TaxID=64659 RepID=A0A9P5Y5W5_9AGAR|nr:hypothetical protein BDZ94DRAFT_800336 [Collybia nuda]